MAVDKNSNDKTTGGQATSATHKNTGGQATGAIPTGMTQKRRWLVFGSNVVVAILLATVLAGAAVWLSSYLLRGKARSDWTSSGQYSLSPRGKAVVKELQTDVAITVIAPEPEEITYNVTTREEAIEAQKARELYRTQYERLSALLNEYELASSHIKVEHLSPSEKTKADKFLDGLKDRFKGQLTGKDAVMKEFMDFRTALDGLVGQEIEKMRGFGTVQPPMPDVVLQNMEVAANSLMKLSKQAQMKMLSEALGAAMPEDKTPPTVDEARDLVSAASGSLKQYPEFYKKILAALSSAEKPIEVPAAVKTFLETAPARYEPIQKKAEDLKNKLQNLGQQKFDEIETSIRGNKESLVFVTDDDAKVVPVSDAWLSPSAEDEEQEAAAKPVFVGERLVSGQLQSFISKDKPALVFVTFGAPVIGWGGPYAGLAERLRQSDLIVQEWDLMRQHEMPKIEEWEKTPPKNPKTILVLVPPPPPNMQRPMPPPTPEAYMPVLEMIDRGTSVILLGDVSQMMMRLPYEPAFTRFGIEPRFECVAVQNIMTDPSRGVERAYPYQTQLTHFGAHPITKALGGLSVAFFRCIPLMPSPKLPEGVQVTPLVLLPTAPDFWVSTDIMAAMSRNGTKRNPEKDIVPTADHPIPLAVAATRKVGDAEQRAVAFGNSVFAYDVIFQQAPRDRAFPGNTELFVNSVLWVAGKDDLLAVSPEVLQAQRLGDIGAMSMAYKIFLVIGMPALALMAGLIVFLIRRR